MENIKATEITEGMTITYAGDTATVVEVKVDNTGFGFDLVMDNGESWFIFRGMDVELISQAKPRNEIRVANEIKAGWKVQIAKHGVITVTETDRGRAAGVNGILIGGFDVNGKMVWERRSRFTSVIRHV